MISIMKYLSEADQPSGTMTLAQLQTGRDALRRRMLSKAPTSVPTSVAGPVSSSAPTIVSGPTKIDSSVVPIAGPTKIDPEVKSVGMTAWQKGLKKTADAVIEK